MPVLRVKERRVANDLIQSRRCSFFPLSFNLLATPPAGTSITFHKGGDSQAGLGGATIQVTKECSKPSRTRAQTSLLKTHPFYPAKHALHFGGRMGEKKGNHNYKTIPRTRNIFLNAYLNSIKTLLQL